MCPIARCAYNITRVYGSYIIFNARRMRVTVLSLCMCVYVCVTNLLAPYLSMAIGFSLSLFDFQLTNLSKMLSFLRKSAFHSYFVVSNPHKRLCTLLVVERSRGARSFYIERTFMSITSSVSSSWSLMIDG